MSCDLTQHHPHYYQCCDYCDDTFFLCHICSQSWPCETKEKHIQERAIKKELK